MIYETIYNHLMFTKIYVNLAYIYLLNKMPSEVDKLCTIKGVRILFLQSVIICFDFNGSITTSSLTISLISGIPVLKSAVRLSMIWVS